MLNYFQKKKFNKLFFISPEVFFFFCLLLDIILPKQQQCFLWIQNGVSSGRFCDGLSDITQGIFDSIIITGYNL